MVGGTDAESSLFRLGAEGLGVGLLVAGLAWWASGDRAKARLEQATLQVPDRPRTAVRPFAERRPAPVAAAGSEGVQDTGDAAFADMVDQFALEWDGLVCRVDQDLGVPNATLVLDGMDPIPAGVFGDRLLGPDLGGVRGDEDAGVGSFLVDGFAPTPFSWHREGGRFVCDEDPVVLREADAGIVGYVANAEGLPEGRVWVTGCGRAATTDEHGAFFLPAGAGPCTVQGFRQDGFWQSRTEAVDVVLVSGEDLELDLTLPERSRGGVGVAIRSSPDGVVIRHVHVGGAAWDAGLEAGSLVLAIEGEAYDPWDLEGFVGAVTGESGTDVELTLLTPDGEEDTVLLDRRAMGPSGS